MRIWHINLQEPLPLETGVRLGHSGSVTRELVRLGHEVTWWSSTFSHPHKRQLRAGDSIERVKGVSIRMLAAPEFGRERSLSAIHHRRCFARRFVACAEAAPQRPDLIWTSVPGIIESQAALRWASLHKIPVVVELKESVGRQVLRGPLVSRALAHIALYPVLAPLASLCKRATAITACTQEQLELGLSLAQRDRRPQDAVYYLGCNAHPISEADTRLAKRAWLHKGLDPKLPTFCYFGRFGRDDDLITLVRAVRHLKSIAPQRRFQVVLGGKGPKWQRIRKQAADCSEILMPGWCKHAQIHTMMRMSRLGLAPYTPASASQALSTKAVEYCAAKLGMVTSLQGEFSRLDGAKAAMWSYGHQDVQALATHLLHAIEDPQRCADMGLRARALFEQNFRADSIAHNLSASFQSLVQGPASNGQARADAQVIPMPRKGKVRAPRQRNAA